MRPWRDESMNINRLAIRLLWLPFCLLLSAPVYSHPALWQIKQGDSTIYLFGTVHLLPNDTAWRFPALDQALAQSKTMYIELVDDDQISVSALVLRYGIDTAHPLSTQLSAADNTALANAIKLSGLPADTLQPMKPWLAALTLSVAPLLKAGLDPAQGVDKQLRTQMEAAGKPVLGLETAEQQIHMLADMSAPMQLAFLRDTLSDANKGTSELLTLIDAWKQGDVAAIARLENEELQSGEPQLYQRLLVERNASWAAQIAQMLKRPGTVFIAVGAAHLAGPDSVQAQLARQNIAVQKD